jgi:hypothetical protein
VTAAGLGGDGSSAHAVQSELVADRFKRQQPNAKVFSFSLKDRGAIFGGGRHPDLTLWYDPKLGQFVSSTAFIDALPPWVSEVAGPAVIEQELSQPWTLLDALWVAAHALTRDEQPGESDYFGYGTVFPHLASRAGDRFAAFRGNPNTDRLLLNLALQALNRSPRDAPVLLAISLSANDYIGHWFGPDSFEAWDELLRLDANLGDFFHQLDRLQGPQNWSAVLSADHGILPLPEANRQLAASGLARDRQSQRPSAVGGRVLAKSFELAARAAAEHALGKGEWIAGLADPYLYLSNDAKRLPAKRKEQLRHAVVSALSAMGGVERVFEVGIAPTVCPPLDDDSLDALVCRSVHPGVGGDFYIALAPGFFFDTMYVVGYGTSHGNASVYDRSVPILARAPGEIATGKVVDAPLPFTLYSHLVDQLLGL